MAQELADAEEQATYHPSKLMKGTSGKSCTTCSPMPSATPLQVEPSPSQLASFTSTLRLPLLTAEKAFPPNTSPTSFQASTDKARSRDRGGTVLGFAIVKAIIEAHLGQVAAKSEGVGKGSTFLLELPIGDWRLVIGDW